MVKVTGSLEQPIKTTDWHKRLCAEVMMLLASVGFAVFVGLRYANIEAMFEMSRTAVFLVIALTYIVARRYLAPRLGTTAIRAAGFGLGAATLTFLYFAGFYSIFETGLEISKGRIDSIVESVDSMAEIATRVLVKTFDIIDFGLAFLLAFFAGMFAEFGQRLWGEPIRAPRV